MLFTAMYSPERWRSLAQDLKRWDLRLLPKSASVTLPAIQSLDLLLTPEVDQERPLTKGKWSVSYAFQAITCADAIDTSGVTTEMVFLEMVGVTRVVSQICMLVFARCYSFIFDISCAVGPRWGDVCVLRYCL
jgi:hypothetical protein